MKKRKEVHTYIRKGLIGLGIVASEMKENENLKKFGLRGKGKKKITSFCFWEEKVLIICVKNQDEIGKMKSNGWQVFVLSIQKIKKEWKTNKKKIKKALKKPKNSVMSNRNFSQPRTLDDVYAIWTASGGKPLHAANDGEVTTLRNNRTHNYETITKQISTSDYVKAKADVRTAEATYAEAKADYTSRQLDDARCEAGYFIAKADVKSPTSALKEVKADVKNHRSDISIPQIDDTVIQLSQIQEDTPIPSPRDEYRFNTNEIHDLIGRSPGWLLHSGITLVAFVTIILLTMSAIIKYPDKITCQGIITTDHPPIALTSKVNGRIEEIFLPSGSEVKQDERLMYIQNTANREDVAQILKFITDYESMSNNAQILRHPIPYELSLGSMQHIYGQLMLKYNEYQQVLIQQQSTKQVQTISREIQKTQNLNHSLEAEKGLYDGEVGLAEKEYHRAQSLYKDGVISAVELEQKEAIYLQHQRQQESMSKSQVQNHIRIEGLRLEQDKIQEQRTHLIDQYRFNIAELIANFRSVHKDWEDIYYVKAENNGQLEYPSNIREDIPITIGQNIGYIIPMEENNTNYYVNALLPSEGKGKINPGSKALIKIDAYPYKEYGILISTVSDMSQVSPMQDKDGRRYYEVKIPIPEMVTDHHEAITYYPEMSVTTELISEDSSILTRIFSQFISLIKNS